MNHRKLYLASKNNVTKRGYGSAKLHLNGYKYFFGFSTIQIVVRISLVRQNKI